VVQQDIRSGSPLVRLDQLFRKPGHFCLQLTRSNCRSRCAGRALSQLWYEGQPFRAVVNVNNCPV
jgi:hypothetical protein